MLLPTRKLPTIFSSDMLVPSKTFYGWDLQESDWFGCCIYYGTLKGLLDGVKQPARIVCGGDVNASDKNISPTVIDFGVDMNAFLPLISCKMTFSARCCHASDVLISNRSLPSGKLLALYCFATDSRLIRQVKNRTSYGGLVINGCLMHLANHELSFGGVGNSGK